MNRRASCWLTSAFQNSDLHQERLRCSVKHLSSTETHLHRKKRRFSAADMFLLSSSSQCCFSWTFPSFKNTANQKKKDFSSINTFSAYFQAVWQGVTFQVSYCCIATVSWLSWCPRLLKMHPGYPQANGLLHLAEWIQAFVTRDWMLWKHRHFTAASHRGSDRVTSDHTWTLSQRNISRLEYKISTTDKKKTLQKHLPTQLRRQAITVG